MFSSLNVVWKVCTVALERGVRYTCILKATANSTLMQTWLEFPKIFSIGVAGVSVIIDKKKLSLHFEGRKKNIFMVLYGATGRQKIEAPPPPVPVI